MNTLTLSRLSQSFRYDPVATARPFDGLSAFAPMWAIATIFSLAGDPQSLAGYRDIPMFLLTWALAGASMLLIVKPGKTWLLALTAGIALLLYAYRLPVASNNKTIAAVMNMSLLLALAMNHKLIAINPMQSREAIYDQLRPVARALLAIMYFYGIFHKINTDFLDPSVSCAVGLYRPLAAPFGLGDNLVGQYLAIYSTFVIEAITIVGLYWRRFFAVGFLIALVFHYIIPISAFSWYMDFSSLVFALYMLSIPKLVSERVYGVGIDALRPFRQNFGRLGTLLPGALMVLLAMAVVWGASLTMPERHPMLMYHSVWILLWAAIGGIAMIVMAWAAVDHLPYRGPVGPRPPLWVYIIPGLFFLSCLSPYVGLKTESSINMFSNLHTEGGETNHLMFDKPPYLFDHQRHLVQITDASPGSQLRKLIKDDGSQMMVLFALKEHLRKHPDQWASFTYNGQNFVHANLRDFARQRAGLVERNLLIFKTVDNRRPKACTH